MAPEWFFFKGISFHSFMEFSTKIQKKNKVLCHKRSFKNFEKTLSNNISILCQNVHQKINKNTPHKRLLKLFFGSSCNKECYEQLLSPVIAKNVNILKLKGHLSTMSRKNFLSVISCQTRCGGARVLFDISGICLTPLLW